MVLEPMPRKTTGRANRFESLHAYQRNNTQHLGPALAQRVQEFLDLWRPVLVNKLLARKATTEG